MPARPDLEAELLLALGLREASTCLRLVQQLVHRRGVGALESLRCRSLAIEPDQRGWSWLSQLVAVEPIAGSSRRAARVPGAAALAQSPERPAVAVPPQGVEATPVVGELAVVGETAVGLGSAPESASASVADAGLGLDSPGEVDGSAEICPGVDAAAQLMEPEPAVLPVLSVGLAPAAAPLASAAQMELNRRVETAVDAAFEALAAEFPEHGHLAAAEPGQLGFAAVETGSIQPEPLVLDQRERFEPEVVQLELVQLELVHAELVATDFVSTELVSAESAQPVGNHQPQQAGQLDQTGESDQVSLAGFAEGWFAIKAPRLELAEPSADLGEPSAELFSASQPYASLEQRPRHRFSFVIPRPLDQELAGEELSSTNAASAGCSEHQGAGDCGQEQAVEGLSDDPSLADQAARLWHRAEGRMGGLRDRVRRRLSLARLKVLVHDCVEEAVSSFQGSNPLVEPQQQGTPEQAFGTAEAAAAADFWPLEPPLAGESLAPRPVVAEAPARLSTTQQVRERLLGRRQDETPPAPAPQALSDLRAWLAADDDLPRAS